MSKVHIERTYERWPTLLIIDDKVDTLLLLRELLMSRGYECNLAASAEEALQSIKTSLPDLILCDVIMPGRSGFELCREVKQNPNTSLIPLILITGLSDRDDRVRGIEAGADAFLTKPLYPEELFAETKRLLKACEMRSVIFSVPKDPSKTDVFISHATEDKDAFVRPLAQALESAGMDIWYDEFTLKLGDSLRRSIEQGLNRARYGIVILSRSFFAKEWPQRELDVLNSKEVKGVKVILPVWFNIALEDIEKYCPLLADRLAVRYPQEPLPRVVRRILEVVRPDLIRA